MKPRQYSLIDKFLIQLDEGLQTLSAESPKARPNPADPLSETSLNSEELNHSAGLMRVNHTGEVCAQALYRGQLQWARTPAVRETLKQAAIEETDHLAWCHERLKELQSHRSYLNPFWYWSSFMIGMIAAAAGDRWSLGFVEETEAQVGRHLQKHLSELPTRDQKSRAIVQEMQQDEEQHRQMALDKGAVSLPRGIQTLMRVMSKVMTFTAYRL